MPMISTATRWFESSRTSVPGLSTSLVIAADRMTTASLMPES